MRTDRSEEEWDLIEQEANRAKIRELNEALEDSELPTYEDLEQEVKRLREALIKCRGTARMIAPESVPLRTKLIVDLVNRTLEDGGDDQE